MGNAIGSCATDTQPASLPSSPCTSRGRRWCFRPDRTFQSPVCAGGGVGQLFEPFLLPLRVPISRKLELGLELGVEFRCLGMGPRHQNQQLYQCVSHWNKYPPHPAFLFAKFGDPILKSS